MPCREQCVLLSANSGEPVWTAQVPDGVLLSTGRDLVFLEHGRAWVLPTPISDTANGMLPCLHCISCFAINGAHGCALGGVKPSGHRVRASHIAPVRSA